MFSFKKINFDFESNNYVDQHIKNLDIINMLPNHVNPPIT